MVKMGFPLSPSFAWPFSSCFSFSCEVSLFPKGKKKDSEREGGIPSFILILLFFIILLLVRTLPFLPEKEKQREGEKEREREGERESGRQGGKETEKEKGTEHGTDKWVSLFPPQSSCGKASSAMHRAGEPLHITLLVFHTQISNKRSNLQAMCCSASRNIARVSPT